MFNNSNSNIIGASGSWEKYTVKAGDTLSGIAAKFHTTVEKLKAINGIKDANKIYAGQILNVRGTYTTGGTSSSGTSVNYTTTTYTVVSGDTLSGIAERYGTTVAELQRL
ncbi:LysM peptidoglycan-binding domain-containing protein, partial [uncultured Granulicatella sp.]|uniref:LysM peptidoglycan-binding domain-containing protein n=2 Tax=Granulicatella TaxID=117563 RepID=UPI0028D88B6A